MNKQLSGNPTDLRQFANALRTFLSYTNETYDEAKMRLVRLNETWTGEGFDQFSADFIASENRLLLFIEQGRNVIQELEMEAEKLERLVQAQQRR